MARVNLALSAGSETGNTLDDNHDDDDAEDDDDTDDEEDAA
jgi:hypothetical protein